MKVLVIFFTLLFSGLLAAQSANSLNSIVMFGDSLSDSGNLYEYMQHKLPQSPPYYEGRFTNGYAWIELLAESYFPTDKASHLLNYAFGGAGLSDDPDIFFTLRREVDSYLLAHQDKADGNSLFIVWIGANNYLGMPEDMDAAIVEVQRGIEYDLRRLAEAGAKHILVMNLPDLGRTPIASEYESQTDFTYMSLRHNELLSTMVKVLDSDYPEVQWLYFDAHHVFDEVFRSPESYGFNNITETCYDVINEKTSKNRVLRMVARVKAKKQADSCEGNFFFDSVHPTAPVHKIMAERSRAFLDAAGIGFTG